MCELSTNAARQSRTINPDSLAIEQLCRKARSLGYHNLREHQLLAVSNLVIGNDVFGVLPTGYGNSLCYAMLLLVFDELFATTKTADISRSGHVCVCKPRVMRLIMIFITN